MELIDCISESSKNNVKAKAQELPSQNQSGIAVLSSKTSLIESYSNRTCSRLRTVRERKQC